MRPATGEGGGDGQVLGLTLNICFIFIFAKKLFLEITWKLP